jgi:hypothetical protein
VPVTGKNHQFTTGWLLVALAVMITVAAILSRAPMRASSEETLVGVPLSPIQISAEWSQEWHEEQGTIALFRGKCRIVQGSSTYTADSMVVWAHGSEETPGTVEHLTVYLEGDVRIEEATTSRTDQAHWLELDAVRGITLTVRGRATDRPGRDDPLFKRAIERKSGPRRSKLRQTQLTLPAPASPDETWRAVSLQNPAGMRRVRVSPRSFSSPFNISSQLSDDTIPPEQVTLITGGVNILVEGVTLENGPDLGVVDLSADRVVVWTDDFNPDQLQRQEQKYQVYLEGNIVIRQRDSVRQLNSVIRASRAYFDARDNRALILDAELETYVAQIDSSIRLRAERIRQNSLKNYHAQNAWVTTSQYGVPGYRLQASDIFIENREAGVFSNNTPPRVDPQTGTLIPEDHYWITALNTQFLVDQFPLFNAPQISIPAENLSTNTPLQGASVAMDRIFGSQIRTTWDVFALTGLTRPDNPRVKLGLQLDYLSYRGPAAGLNGNYSGTDSAGNVFTGTGLGYYINDNGHDNLGFDRRHLNPNDPNRGILQWEHRYNLEDYGTTLFGEIGYVSDRNFREQYRELDFDTKKDLETKLQVNQKLGDNSAATFLVRPQLNDIENNTQWLPRADLYFLGEPLAGNLLNYSSHSSAGYATLNPARAPSDLNDIASPLPYMTQASGIVAQTRHEIELPFSLGALRFAPFVMGEAAFWGDSFSGESIDRLYGRAGLRASISFQRIFPYIQSEIFNLNGLAHRSLVDAEYGISGSTRKLSDIAQWNEFDDNAQERFRMRFLTNTFDGVLPAQFDPRFYAVRQGAGSTVTAPYNELVADQQVLRLNWHQRLQTKVGPADRQRIKDWMTLDLGASIFPAAGRDDFGQTIGLVSSRYAWHVGDRTSILASSLYDFFPEGQQMWSVGVLNQRSLRGSVYVGLRQVKGGPLDSQIATATYSYVLSPKWISSATTAYDIGEGRNRGQGFTLTRVGEWLLFHLGANFDASKNNVGLGFSIEPRLGRGAISSTQLGSLQGMNQQ